MNTENKLKNIISKFTPISLAEMDKVKLMRRTDTKFVFSKKHLPQLLKKAIDSYFMVEIENEREQIYLTTYFDTSNYTMYHLHHNGKLNRHKVRIRKYVYTNQEFLEVKRKNNKGETIKKRIENENENENHDINSPGQDSFIQNYTPFLSEKLAPTLGNRFTRITLVNKNMSERITLDYNLHFKNLKHKNETNPDDICIAEIKKNRDNKDSQFIDYLRQLRINPVGFSKYCMGMAMLNPDVKSNNFKQKIRRIVKL